MQCAVQLHFLCNYNNNVSSLASLLSLPLSLFLSLTLSISIFDCSCLTIRSVGGWSRSSSDDHSGNASVQYQEWDCKFTQSAVESIACSLPRTRTSFLQQTCSLIEKLCNYFLYNPRGIRFSENRHKLWNNYVCICWTLMSVWLESVNWDTVERH